MPVSFLIKFQAQVCNSIEQALAQVFSSEFCEIFKNAFLYRTPSVAASDVSIGHEEFAHAFRLYDAK